MTPKQHQMSDRNRIFIVLGALILFLATVLGAYGTHGIEGVVSAQRWNAYQVAVDYQFYHGLGVITAAILSDRFPQSQWIRASGWLLLVGIIIFAGSIYATTFGAPDEIGALAPFGGLSMMAGWLSLALGALRAK